MPWNFPIHYSSSDPKNNPETALSDGYQSLTFDAFAKTMDLCRKVAEALGRTIG